MMQANSGGASPPNAKPHQRANWQGFKNQNQQTNYSKSAADCLYELRNVMLETIGSAPECVRQLRRLRWNIATEWVEQIDQDSRKIKVGRYHLAPEHIPLAAEVTL